MILLRYFLSLFLLIRLMAVGSYAHAFTVEGPYRGGRTAIDHLNESPRWAANSGSLVIDGERGLGGGLEYTIDPSICQLRFIDDVDCNGIKTALRITLELWAEGHPSINFKDVTGEIEPAFPLGFLGQSAQGAEIDFLGVGPIHFPLFAASGVNGHSFFYSKPSPPYSLTNGQFISPREGSLQSVDIRFNSARCYFLNPDLERRDCVHFQSLAMHEIGHALGIGHPDELAQYNLDTDYEPGNEIKIDCRNPTAGLIPSPNIDGAAIAIGQDVYSAGRWKRGLTWDDVAARDALYPHCDIQRIERSGKVWGAFARNEQGGFASITNRRTRDEAVVAALTKCEAQGEACVSVASFNDCFAYATDGSLVFGVSSDPRSGNARGKSVLACQEQGAVCRVRHAVCAFDETLGY